MTLRTSSRDSSFDGRFVVRRRVTRDRDDIETRGSHTSEEERGKRFVLEAKSSFLKEMMTSLMIEENIEIRK